MPSIYAVEIPIPLGMEAGISVDYTDHGDYGSGRVYVQAYAPEDLYGMLGYLISAMIERQATVGEQYMGRTREDMDWLSLGESTESFVSEDQQTVPSILLPTTYDTNSDT